MLPIIRKLIEESETYAISYSTYMQTVLYHPESGYYMKEKEKVGRNGDFVTSSAVSAAFAKQFARLFIRLIADGVVPPRICEIGGGTGSFAEQLLREWKHCSPETFSQAEYILIETSPYHRRLQRTRLQGLIAPQQYEDLADLPNGFKGIIFSNELLDAFPVEVVERHGDTLHEVYVSLTEQGLTEVLRPLSKPVAVYMENCGIPLADGQRFEAPLAANAYFQRLAQKLEQGLIITVDYGYTNEEWQQPQHREGSLRGYYKHQMVTNPLAYPGEMDVTVHIHWDDLQQIGEAAGLQTVLHMKQRQFLLAAGILEQLVAHHDPNPFSEQSRQNRAVRTMIMNGGMSDSFDVLLQQKGLSPSLSSYFDISFLPI